MLSEGQWQMLVLAACDDDGTVLSAWDENWARTESLDTADPSGELRYRRLVVLGLELMVARSVTNVQTTDGGGQSGQWNQYHDHLVAMLAKATEEYNKYVKSALFTAKGNVGEMVNHTLTPPAPGHIDLGDPRFLGDLRYG